MKIKVHQSLMLLVSGYLDFVERQAEREIAMTMADWAKHLDNILLAAGEKVLKGNGKISHQEAMDKAEAEYKKYKAKTLSTVEEDYLTAITTLAARVKKTEQTSKRIRPYETPHITDTPHLTGNRTLQRRRAP